MIDTDAYDATAIREFISENLEANRQILGLILHPVTVQMFANMGLLQRGSAGWSYADGDRALPVMIEDDADEEAIGFFTWTSSD